MLVWNLHFAAAKKSVKMPLNRDFTRLILQCFPGVEHTNLRLPKKVFVFHHLKHLVYKNMKVWIPTRALEQGANPQLSNDSKYKCDKMLILHFYLVTQQGNSSFTRVFFLSFFFKDTQRGGEGPSKQVLFLWFFSIQGRRGENIFSSHNPWNHMRTGV